MCTVPHLCVSIEECATPVLANQYHSLHYCFEPAEGLLLKHTRCIARVKVWTGLNAM